MDHALLTVHKKRFLGKEEVPGSNPGVSSMNFFFEKKIVS
jgi:hypothetical protein